MEAFLPDGLQKGRGGGYDFFKWSAVEVYVVVVMPCALFCLSYQP